MNSTRLRAVIAAVAVSALLSACATTKANSPGAASATVTSLHKIARQNLCVTEGEVRDAGGGQMEVDSPAMRAVVAGSEPEVAELRFLYRGPTSQTSALGNGEVRRQVALKLRAEDSCNVIYVVWRFEPDSKFVVQTKRNPGKPATASAATMATRRFPRRSRQVPPPKPGDEHLFQASLTGERLQVFLDRDLVWQGSLGAAADFSGPVGIRTDNARLALRWRHSPGTPATVVASATTADRRRLSLWRLGAHRTVPLEHDSLVHHEARRRDVAV